MPASYEAGIFICSLSPPLGQPQAQQDEGDGTQGLGADGLTQDEGGGDESDDRGEVDIDIGGHGADEGHGPVPADKAQGGGGQTQVEDVEEPRGVLQERRQGEGRAQEGEEEEHGEQAIEKDLPGGLELGEALAAGGLQTHPVESPGEGGTQGEQVPQGIQIQTLSAGQGDEGDAAHGDEKAQKEGGPGPARPAEGPQQQGGEHGGRRDDDAHIGGQRILQSGVLQDKVEGEAGDACAEEGQLIPQALGPDGAGGEKKEDHPGDDEAEGHDLQWGEGRQQQLGGDEGGAPDHCDEKGHAVTQQPAGNGIGSDHGEPPSAGCAGGFSKR